MSQLDNLSVRDAKVIAHRAKGMPIRKVASETNLSPTTVQKLTSKHKDIIAAQQARLVEVTLPTIIDRAIKEINHANSIDIADRESQVFLARIDKKEDTILKSVGIAPSHTQSMHVNNIYNDHRKEVISPVIADMLQGKIASLTESIDAEFSEVE